MRIIDPELQARRNARNEKMRIDFLKKHAEGFRCEVILAGLADKYFLSVGTVEAIVMKWGKYKEQLQTNSSHERSILNTH